MEAPTSFLPLLKRLDEYTAPQIHKFLTRLVTIYLPEVRGTAPIDEDLEPLHSDEFERSFTIRWLTGFIARGEEWTELFTDGEEDLSSGAPATTSDASIGRFQTDFLEDTYLARTTAFDRAAALLGACAGTSASGAISRELKFPTSLTPPTDDSNSSSITILLRDESISTGDHTAVGLQTWGSACILAERIAHDPAAFGLPDPSSKPTFESKAARVLELGAGTGLLSLLAGKLVERAAAAGSNHPDYTIIATDYHPAVLANLRANVQGNFPNSSPVGDSPIDVRPLDWSLYLTGEPTTDLSRAPSVVPTPAVGTPVNGSGHSGGALAIPDDSQSTSIPGSSMSPPIETPSFSVTSTISTPNTSYSPQTPQTPRTARSPPPNLARAVFSRLIARGLKFEMPGGPPGIDQNSEQAKKSDSYSDSPITDSDFSAHSLDSVPTPVHLVSSLDSDVPKIEDQMVETNLSFSARISSPAFPLGVSRSELLCAYIQDEESVSSIDSGRENNNVSYLDEMDRFRCSDNRDVISNPGENQLLAVPQAPVPGFQTDSIANVGGLSCLEASNKVLCLEIDSAARDIAVGTETPPFKISDAADGVDLLFEQGQVPHIDNPIVASPALPGQVRMPRTFNYNPEIDIASESDSKTAHGDKGGEHPSNSILGDSTSKKGRISNSQTPSTSAEPPFDQPFDVIFGADIVYELSHVTLVRGVVERLLRKPSYMPGAPPAYFHLIMPLRPTHADEANSVDKAFPRAEDVVDKGVGESEVLAIVKTETYARSAGVGRADEVQYVHYCVGWV